MPVREKPERLSDLPLWRLLVCLADSERTLGVADPLTQRLAEIVRERLAKEPEQKRPACR